MYALNAQEISYKEHFRDAMRRKVVCMPTLYLYSFKNNSFHFTSILYDFIYIEDHTDLICDVNTELYCNI